MIARLITLQDGRAVTLHPLTPLDWIALSEERWQSARTALLADLKDAGCDSAATLAALREHTATRGDLSGLIRWSLTAGGVRRVIALATRDPTNGVATADDVLCDQGTEAALTLTLHLLGVETEGIVRPTSPPVSAT